MAIFVSNPTSAAITTLSPDALDPSVMSPEEGFTEELAAAMQPSAAPTDASAKSPLDMLEDAGKKASDLQILPAEVLMNAVGDANFAFAGQAGAANSAAQNSVTGTLLTDATETLLQDTTEQDLADQLQGAELAAANLAAQLSASGANVPVPLAANSAEVTAALSINATAGAGQAAAQASQPPVTGPSLQEGELASSATTLASAQNTPSVGTESISAANVSKSQVAQQQEGELASSATTLASAQNTPSVGTESISAANVSKSQVAQQLEANASTASQASSMAAATATQVQVASSVQSDAARNVAQVNAASKANAASASEVQVQTAINTATNKVKSEGMQKQASTQADTKVATDPSLTLNSEASSVVAKASSEAGVDAVANEASSQSTPLAASTVANSSDNNINRTDSTLAPPSNSSVSTLSLAPTNLATERTTVSSDTKADVQANEAQESSFNFDAKLGKPDALQNPKVIETAVSLAGVAKPSAQVQNTNLASNSIELGVEGVAAVSATPAIDPDATTFSNVQSGMKAGRTGEAFPATAGSPTANTAPANRLDSAVLTAANPNSAVIAQESARAETTQSLEDISSSFVSSLVGGPQRPVTTVMDWISMQSQERPAALVPHEVRLDAGAVQLEIQKMVKQGGGHVVMELTPPDQSKFTIELKLDERGNALLIVEGVSDSTKTRLEQSAPQLREQFQQLGLELQLDMRQQGQSASSNAANFADAQERGSDDNNLKSNGADNTTKVLTQREAGAIRARETGSNQVYLYA